MGSSRITHGRDAALLAASISTSTPGGDRQVSKSRPRALQDGLRSRSVAPRTTSKDETRMDVRFGNRGRLDEAMAVDLDVDGGHLRSRELRLVTATEWDTRSHPNVPDASCRV
jgi:hypothetical protein